MSDGCYVHIYNLADFKEGYFLYQASVRFGPRSLHNDLWRFGTGKSRRRLRRERKWNINLEDEIGVVG